MRKTYVTIGVLILLMSTVAFSITGIGQNTSLLLVSAQGHLGANITSEPTDTNMADRKTFNRVEGAYGVGGVYNNGSTAVSGRFNLLDIDIFNPVIYNVAATATSRNSETISWSTDEDSTTVVYYGTSATALTSTYSSGTFTQTHSALLENLAYTTTYYYNVSSCDRFSFCKVDVTTRTFTTMSAAVSSGASGGSGGGGVYRSDDGYTKTRVFALIKAGEIKNIPITSEFVPFTDVSFKLNKDVEGAEIKITRIDVNKLPTDTPEVNVPVYAYLNLEHNKINQEDVDSTTIKFKVTKDWLLENKVDAEHVALLRLENGVWKELSTTIISDGEVYVGFQAIFRGMSYFAIVGKESAKQEVVTKEKETTEKTTEEKTEEKKDEVTGSAVEEPKEGETQESIIPKVEKKTQMWIGAIIFVVLLVIGYLVYRRIESREE